MSNSDRAGRVALASGQSQVRALLLLAVLTGVLGTMIVLLARALSGPALPEGVPETMRHSEAMQQAVDSIPDVLRASERYITEGRFSEAVILAHRARQRFPEDQRIRLQLARARTFAEQYELAVEEYLEALRIGPRDPGIHSELATVANKAGRLDLALEHFEVAAAKEPSNDRYLFYLAMVQLKSGQRDKCQATLLRALRVNPELAEAWGTLAELQFQDNNLSIASDQIARARELAPAEPRWRLVQARILIRQNKPEEAVNLLSGLPADLLRQKDYLRVLGEAYGLMGQPISAAALYGQARNWSPNDPELNYQEALWWERAGSIDQAIELARVAAQLGHPQGPGLLERLVARREGRAPSN